MSTGVTAINEEVQRASAFVQPLFAELNKVIIGQRYLLERLCISLLANGHVLLEGVPGLGKTLLVRTLASALHLKFSRIQFTPDLMPSDITGYELLGRDEQTGAPRMTFRPGPVRFRWSCGFIPAAGSPVTRRCRRPLRSSSSSRMGLRLRASTID